MNNNFGFKITFILLLFFSDFCTAQFKLGENYYYNEDKDLISISFKDTILSEKQNTFIYYEEIDHSQNRILKNCIFNKQTGEVINSYFITNDLSTEVYTNTESNFTNIKMITNGDTTLYNKEFDKTTNSFAFINLLLTYSDIFEREELVLILFPILPKPFEFIANNEGMEQLKVGNETYNCYHIIVNADSFIASAIMPDYHIWFEKESRIMIKNKVSDHSLTIKN
jgi:hypothetical protein